MADSPPKPIAKALDRLAQVPEPLERLAMIRDAQDALERMARATADEARAAGATWKRIGAVYGVSKQAAQQRFRPRTTTPATADAAEPPTSAPPTADPA